MPEELRNIIILLCQEDLFVHFILCVLVFFSYIPMHHECEVGRQEQVVRWSCVTMWVLGIEPESSVREAKALKY